MTIISDPRESYFSGIIGAEAVLEGMRNEW